MTLHRSRCHEQVHSKSFIGEVIVVVTGYSYLLFIIFYSSSTTYHLLLTIQIIISIIRYGIILWIIQLIIH